MSCSQNTSQMSYSLNSLKGYRRLHKGVYYTGDGRGYKEFRLLPRYFSTSAIRRLPVSAEIAKVLTRSMRACRWNAKLVRSRSYFLPARVAFCATSARGCHPLSEVLALEWRGLSNSHDFPKVSVCNSATIGEKLSNLSYKGLY